MGLAAYRRPLALDDSVRGLHREDRGDAALGSRLLCLDDDAACDEIAARLSALNEERQAMEQTMLAEADAEVAAEIGSGEGPAVLVVGSNDWHPGIVGLISARLKERYRRPAFAIAFDGSGRGTGSGRSIGGFDLGRLDRRLPSREGLEVLPSHVGNTG